LIAITIPGWPSTRLTAVVSSKSSRTWPRSPTVRTTPRGGRHQGNPRDVVANDPLVLAAQQDFLALRVHLAAGQLDILAAEYLRDLLQRQTVFPQRLLGDLHVDLEVLDVHQFGLRDRGQQQQFAADRLGHLPQRHFRLGRGIVRADQADADGGRPKGDLLDFRVFGQVGKTGDAVDLGAHLLQDLLDVDVRLQVQDQEPGVFLSHGDLLFQAADRPHRFLDLLADPLFHLGRRGARVGHRHQDDLQFEFGKNLAAHHRQTDGADHHDRQHQRVHRRGIRDGPTDYRSHVD
jgi:hypothetical protein